jgi:SynChlorMet cassette radical SAM/SPASM protein ScmF
MIEQPPQPPTLNELYVYVTNGCNCACRHCWIVPENSGKAGRPVHFIAPEIFEAAVKEALPLGLNAVKWTGGEPTIHPEFARLLQIQKKYDLAGRLETNGMQVTAELAELLQECGVTGVSVSLDGATAATHDAVRNVPGGFKRTLAGIGNLVKAGYRPEIIMSLMRANIGELESLLDLAAELGAGQVKLNIIQPTLRGSDLHESGDALSVRELLDLNQRLQEEFQPRYELPIFLDVPMAFRPLGNLVEGDGLSSCGILGILGLLADGHYALCGVGEHVPELVYGQAGVGRLAEIWASHPVLNQLREGLPKDLKGVCGDCLMKNVCLGSCVAMNYQQGQGLMAPYWFCEQAHAEQLFPASRLKGEPGLNGESQALLATDTHGQELDENQKI